MSANNTPNEVIQKENSTPKRKHSPEPTVINQSQQNTSILSAQKRTKSCTMPSEEFNQLKDVIADSTATISTKIDVATSALDTKISDLATKVNDDVSSLRNSVDDFNNKVSAEIVNIKSHLNAQNVRVDNLEDDMQRIKLRNDLRLTGFAFKDNENLLEVFNKVANVIEFAMDDKFVPPTLERPQFKNRLTGQLMTSDTILLHFAVTRQKEMFYTRYLTKMPLESTKFGLPTGHYIRVSENLTIKNAKILKAALSYKKDKKLSQAYTEDGIVFVRFSKAKTSPAHPIRNSTALEILVTQNNLSTEPTADATGNNITNEVSNNGSENMEH